MKLIGYCRVSTDNQKEEGTIEIQRSALSEYSRENGFDLVNIFCDEGVSGGLEDRPALSDLFSFLEDHPEIEGVLIYKLDRLARDLYIQEHLIKKMESLNKKLLSIKEPNLESTDPMRKAFRQFMGIVSELEKAFITMRLKEGRKRKARRGGYAGGSTAFGYSAKDKELEINPEQADTVKTIFKMKRYQRKSLGEIARDLNNRNVSTARGGKWYPGTVKYILENPIYKGSVAYKGEVMKRGDLSLV